MYTCTPFVQHFFAFATCLDLKWSFKGFDKSVAKVSDFIVISVSAFSEGLFVCYQRKFTSVSLRRILKTAIICQKEREGIIFLFYLYFGKTLRAFQRKQSK